jgi:aminoglycoside phosphotransferase (APT) family kinase protein
MQLVGEEADMDAPDWSAVKSVGDATAAVDRHVVSKFREIGRRMHVRRQVGLARALVPQILVEVGLHTGVQPRKNWRIHRASWTLTNVVVILVGPPTERASLVLKLPQSNSGLESLQRQATALAGLSDDERLDGWRSLVPTLALQGRVGDQCYTVEHALPGQEVRTFLPDHELYMHACTAAAAAIGELHRRTSTELVVDQATLDGWINQPLDVIQQKSIMLRANRQYAQLVNSMVAELSDVLAGRTMNVSWIHGDFWPGNVLVTSDGSTVTGIVDWDLAAPHELAVHDVLQLVMHTPRLLARRYELADTVRALLRGEPWTPDEQTLLEAAQLTLPQDEAAQRALLLLYWLRYIATYLHKCPERGSDEAWMQKNIQRMMQCAL